MNEAVMHQPKKMGRLRKSWLITKSAWRVLMLDKEIMVVPFVTGIILFVLMIVLLIVSLVVAGTVNHGNSFTFGGWAFVIASGILLVMVSTFTTGTVLAMALERLRGGDPSIRFGLRAVKKRFGSLLAYGLLNAGVNQTLGFLEQRLPLAGAIVAWLTNIAWSIASIFAIAVVVDSPESIGPIKALKKSMGMFRKTWGESLATKATVGLIMFLIILLEMLVGGGLAFNFLRIDHLASFGITISLTFLLMLATIFVGSILQGIVTAGLYHYATTGEAPDHFDRELMKQAFTIKKARKVFGKAVTF